MTTRERTITPQAVPVHMGMMVRLSLIFLLSGASSLLYQVAWQRLLTVNYGVGALSITLIVSIYMLGLGLGALIGGRLASRYAGRSILLYCLFEALLGVFGLLSLPILQALGVHTAGAPFSVYCVCISLFLALPTILMGATLPLLTETLTRLEKNFAAVVSTLYSVNTIGASLGALLAAYVIISFFGLDSAVYTAVAINFLLAATTYFALPRADISNAQSAIVEAQAPADAVAHPSAALICLWVFTTGFVAIGFEIVWFRTIETLCKSSPYAFATVLSIYLAGIGLGSWLMRRMGTVSMKTKKRLYFGMQCLIAVYVTASYALLKSPLLQKMIDLSNGQELHPCWTNNIFSSWSAFQGGWFAAFDILIWPVYFMLLPTILMGASFPLASILSHSGERDAGETVARVYFFTIGGNVLGGVITGFALLQYLGTSISTLVLCLLATVVFVPSLWMLPGRGKWLTAAVLASFAVILPQYPSSARLVRLTHPKPPEGYTGYVQESASCIDLAFNKDDTVWHFINGLAHGGRAPHMYGFSARAIEAMSRAQKCEKVLVIGYGTGTIVETVLRTSRVKSVTLVELNDAVMINLQKMPVFQKMLADKRIDLHIEDGRRFLNSRPDCYDVILMDPLRSTTAYSNNIYSKEFFALLSSRLHQGGIVMVWLDNLDILPRTIASVFKKLYLDSSFCLASNGPMVLDRKLRDELLSTYTTEQKAAIARNGHYLGDESIIEKTTGPINTDLKPAAEYHLGQIGMTSRDHH